MASLRSRRCARSASRRCPRATSGLLPAIHVPVYAINSDLLPTDAARIRRSLPDFHLDVLDHTGHFLMLEAPARFNPLLLQDLQAITQRAAH